MGLFQRPIYKNLFWILFFAANLAFAVWIGYVCIYLFSVPKDDWILKIPIPLFRLIGSFLGILVLLGIYVYLIRINQSGFLKSKFLLPGIFALTVMVRLGWLYLIGRINLDSDFQLYMSMAVALLEKGRIPLENQWYISYAPYVVGYSSFLATLFSIFGKSLLVAQLANVILAGVSAVLIFEIASKINHSRESGLIAGLLWVFMLPIIAMVTLPSTEQLFITLLLGAIYVCVRMPMRIVRRLDILWILLLGGITVWMNEIRPLGILFVTGFILYKVITTRPKRRLIANSVLQLGIFLCVYFLAPSALNGIKENIIGTPFSNNPFGFGLYLGLNYETKGTWSSQDAVLVGKAQQAGISAAQFQQQMTGLSVKRLEDLLQQGLIFHHFSRKVATFWTYPDAFLSWTQVSMENRMANERLFRVLFPLADGQYGTILLLGFVDLFLISHRKDYTFHSRDLFIKTLLLGYFISLLIFDNNSRYLVPALPLFCLLAASGVEDLSSAILSKRLKPDRVGG